MSIPDFISSDKTYTRLSELIPGGVNSPFRSFHLVGGTARVLRRGLGSRVWDVEGREYIDLCGAWGPLVLGHAHPAVIEAASQALLDGAIFGAPTPWELELAELVRRAVPSLEMLRFVNSGAEAVMSALRVARAATGRSKIVKFEGCYHGHVACLDAVGLEAEEAGGSLAMGSSPSLVADTLLAIFNDLTSVEALLTQHDVAAVIVEPVTGSMGVIPPEPDFLPGLRQLCDQHGALLIFDEVLTGFRVAAGGAQQLYDVRPDLTCLGKALGGGLPVGAYGGRPDLMQRLAPLGPVYQAGTFCGNPVTMRAGIAALTEYLKPGFYQRLDRLGERLCQGLAEIDQRMVVQRVGSMFSVGFGPSRLRDHRDARRLDARLFGQFFHALLAAGIYLPPSTWDAACVSWAHTEADLDEVLERAANAWNAAVQRTKQAR
ncbi:MAG: aspartate aminotransferase family protein [Vulcanimicrobiota bacterium]